ncbi:nucleoside 2-deoxyribosyltransferase domain-containing protein [Staphylococcus arlettae]|uniref:nucleoside 2-deoxyribosyltransferase domain-containing protein n=1 Tax=Staphylococcus arlettae TaxID=29378 RepID=UPI0021D27327|nr:nucleoside 2-deoxyribosyltransferase domain-containing protein [Staphylococcus arlettae]UXU53185.1 nucleoside 2-deoxyribosyltransferase domain-containing protein [Staphylococcus arlettae]
MTKTIYIAGDMLSHGQQLRRAYEKSAFKQLGYEVYNPQDDKSINDKSSADQQGLAERIVANDTRGIENADIIVLDYLTHAQGTICELGYIQKLKREKPELEVYVHCTDVRQGTGHIPTEQDRAEFSINQYVYGVILEVTEGRGVQDFEDIRQALDSNKKLNEHWARTLRNLAHYFGISDPKDIVKYDRGSDAFGHYEEVETVDGVKVRIEREAE